MTTNQPFRRLFSRAATLVLMLLTASTAWADLTKENVSYIDADGTQKSVEATVLTGDITQSGFEIDVWGTLLMPAGWYVVKNSNTNGVDASCNTDIEASGDRGTIHLILADGAEMTVNGGSSDGFDLGTGYPLAIYGQSAGTGRLTVSSRMRAIYSNSGITINGGIISATSGDKLAIESTEVTINGGIVSATSGNYFAIESSKVTINGGQVTATGGENHVGIHSIASTLGCRKLTDFIKSNGFNGSMTIKSGQTLYDGTTAYSGTLSRAQISVLANSTLRPFSSADLAVSDDGTEYTIKTATGWGLFCDMLADGETFSGKTVNLDANIGTAQDPITRWAGSSGHEFQGTFDGGGNTLTVDYSSNSYADTAAPFSYVSGATIQNLVVAGNCGGTYGRAAGIVGESASMTAITNCISSVTISGGPFNGGISIGGLVDIEGCIYNGRINTTDRSGGFVGFAMSTTRIANSLFDPQEGSTIVGGTFYNISNTATITNCYYTRLLGTAQGKAKRTVTAGENVTVALSGTATEYDVSGITAYKDGNTQLPGLLYNSTIYAGSEDAVSLTLDHSDRTGYTFKNYTATGGTLSGNTLTMPDADVTIGAQWILNVPYIDENGEQQYCTNYTVIEMIDEYNYTPTSLEAGKWYVLKEYASIGYLDGNTITGNGAVNIILCDGATLYYIADYNNLNGSLNIYGQSAGTGEFECKCIYGSCDAVMEGNLTLYGGKVSFVGHEYSEHYKYQHGIHGNVTIYGGSLTTTGGDGYGGGAGHGIWGDVTMYGGSLTTKGGEVTLQYGDDFGGAGIHGSVTMQGGTLTANGGFCKAGIDGNVIFHGGSLNAQGGDNKDNVWYGITGDASLSWTNATDRFTANSIKGTVTVASGKAFTSNGTDLYSGQLASGSINGKTLQPATAIALADNADNRGLITAANDLTLDVTLQGRTLNKDGNWNTLCLPFNATLTGDLANATLMELDTENKWSMVNGQWSISESGHATGLDNGTLCLNFKDATSIKAGKPYIIKWEGTYMGDPIQNPTFTGATVSSTEPQPVIFTGGQFVGTYDPIEWQTEDKSILFLGVGKNDQNQDVSTLYYPQPDLTDAQNPKYPRINACRAYFQLNGVNNVKEFRLNFGEDDSADGIENVQCSMFNVQCNDAWYDLSGRRLGGKPTQQGLYIYNGKKTVIK